MKSHELGAKVICAGWGRLVLDQLKEIRETHQEGVLPQAGRAADSMGGRRARPNQAASAAKEGPGRHAAGGQ